MFVVCNIQWVVMCVVYVCGGQVVGCNGRWEQTRMRWGVSLANDVALILYSARLWA